jgi:hypothetical protein
MPAREYLATTLSLAVIGSSGEPGFPAESNATQPAFRRVIREANTAVAEKARERIQSVEPRNT